VQTARGPVDNADALTTGHMRDRINSTPTLGGLIKDNQQTASNLTVPKNGPAARSDFKGRGLPGTNSPTRRVVTHRQHDNYGN
jgi:hypothetical protein